MKLWLAMYFICGITFTIILHRKHLKKLDHPFTQQIRDSLDKSRSRKERVSKKLALILGLITTSVLWMFILTWHIFDRYFRKNNQEVTEEKKFKVTDDSLVGMIDPALEEKKYIIQDPLGKVPSQPFGHLHRAWIDFLIKSETAESIWLFEIKIGDMVSTWYSKEKRPSSKRIKGFAGFRNGKVLSEFIFESS